MTSKPDPNDLVPARRKAGWPPVIIAAREDVIQPLEPCDCHDKLVWHPGEVALVRRGELDAGREDIEPVDAPNAPAAAVAVELEAEPEPEPEPDAAPSNILNLGQQAA